MTSNLCFLLFSMNSCSVFSLTSFFYWWSLPWHPLRYFCPFLPYLVASELEVLRTPGYPGGISSLGFLCGCPGLAPPLVPVTSLTSCWFGLGECIESDFKTKTPGS